MTFKEWLLIHIDDNSPTGDFARDALEDATFPDVIASDRWRGYRRILTYLYQCAANDGALGAFKKSWLKYKEETCKSSTFR